MCLWWNPNLCIVQNTFCLISPQFEVMDSIYRPKNPESVENEGCQFSQCLGVSLIIRQCMEYVCSADLIELSKVNKLWNFEARSMMRDRGCFTARLKSEHPCEDLRALVSLLPSMAVIPFAGVSMDLDSSHVCSGPLASTEKLNSIHHEILAWLPWKNLSAKLAGRFSLDMKCPALQVLVQVLQKFCGNLEELSLYVGPFSIPPLKKAIENSKFPNLKTFRYEADDKHFCFYDHHRNLIHDVVSRTEPEKPLELHLNKYIDRMESTLEVGLVKLVANYEFNPFVHYFPDNVLDKLRLQKLTLSFLGYRRALTFESYNRIVPVLLRSSCTWLNSLRVDLVDLLPLMHYGVSLKNLASLTIDVKLKNEELAEPKMLTLVQASDVPRIFPRLKKFHVILYSFGTAPRDDMKQFVEQYNDVCMEEKQDRARSIKLLAYSLIGNNSSSEDSALPFIAQIFPRIDSRLSFKTYETLDSLIGNIWKQWAGLKELEVRALFGKYILSEDRLSIQTLNENFDSEFCGIFPEEVAELRKMDDEFLKAVNIVPVMPSITCLRALRMFKMFCTTNCYPFGKHDATFIFSKVTCLTVFARCPELSVTLETDSRPLAKALSHVKPYVSVVFDEAMGKQNLR